MRNLQVSERPTGEVTGGWVRCAHLRGTETGLKEIHRKEMNVRPFRSTHVLGSTWAFVTPAQEPPPVNGTEQTRVHDQFRSCSYRKAMLDSQSIHPP